MSSTTQDDLGGRLALRTPQQLDEQQRRIHAALSRLVLPEAAEAGYVAQVDGERFIGPFNALLRVPAIAGGMGQWIGEINAHGLPAEVREAVILTVAVHWGAAFAIYAHVAGARTAGLPEQAIDAILAGRAPNGLREPSAAAQQLTARLLGDHHVPDDVYARATGALGEDGVVAVLSLVGQYQTISGILVAFAVPTPEPGAAAMTEQVVATPDGALSSRTVALAAPGHGEVRVAVRASGVNPADFKAIARMPPGSEPTVLGFEAAGVITALGPAAGGGDLAVGDEVIVFPVLGSYASELNAPVEDVLPKPSNLDFAQAANLLLVGATAAEMLERTGVVSGDTILVHGASSATGTSLLQQVAALGDVRVIGTASPASFDRVRAFGAEPIAYGDGLERRVRDLAPDGIDASLDCVSTEEAMQVAVALVPDSRRLVTIADRERAQALQIPFIDGREPRSLAYRNAQRGRLVQLSAEGRLTVPIARTFPLAAAADALALSRDGHPGGKIALLV